MFFVGDQMAAATWYRDHVLQRGSVVEDDGYVYLDVAGFEVGFHPADHARNPQGGSVVAYFGTGELDAQRAELLEAGATDRLGPLDIGRGEAICQLIDPFGDILGLQGQRG